MRLLLNRSATDRVAALPIAFFKRLAQACRPVSGTLTAQRAQIVLPGRRAVSVICSAFPSVQVVGHCGSLRVEDHSTMTEFLGVGQSFSELGKASANGSPR